MDDTDLMDDDVDLDRESPGRFDDSLLAQALIKAEKLRDYASERDDGGNPATRGIIRDFNVLRGLVVLASPKLAAILPPELPAQEGPASGSNQGIATFGEIHLFCDQIKDFLENRREEQERLSSRIDDGASLFGPDGLEHDPTLLAAARAKAQGICDFVRSRQVWSGGRRVPVGWLRDYNQLLALIREAAPESASALPREMTIPADPKPTPEDRLASSNGSWFFSILKRDRRPKALKYSEFYYHCQQIARLLK